MLGDMLTKLSARQQLTPQTMVYIGNLFNDLDMAREAENEYGTVLAKATSDPEFMKSENNQRLINAVRARQIGLLRKRGKFQESIQLADKLCQEFPNALEPLVERAKIYQDWALKDPSKFDDAIGSWTIIRRRLENQVPSGKSLSKRQIALRQSYYDAIYNTAACLLAQAKGLQAVDRKAAAEKAVIGEKVLNSVLELHPKLDGTPATVKRFNAIQARLEAIRLQRPDTAPASGDGAFDGRGAGNWATGNWATGNWATGDWATGDWATGDWAFG